MQSNSRFGERRCFGRFGSVAAVVLSLIFFAGTRACLAADGKTVSETDKLQFTQKQIDALMGELQERMFHLSELTKQAEPDNSTRLVLALRKAREELIIEQMSEILEKLGKNDLAKATDDTKQVLVKLNELKKLLMAEDLELELALERLHRLQEAIKKVDMAIKVETQQKTESNRLADMLKNSAVKKQAFDRAKKNEAGNRKNTASVAQDVKSIGQLDAAVQALASSGQSMSSAEGHLGSGVPADASTDQTAALKNLVAARAILAHERQRVLAQLQDQVKQIVIDNLQQMLDRQTAIRHTTEVLSPKLAKQREAVLQLQQLGAPEQHIAAICQTTIDLVEETEFSVTLGPALEAIEKDMLLVSGNLLAGHGDEPVIESEKAIEADLKDLLDTFKDMPSSTSQCDGECSGCKGNLNKLLAELKVVRMMQLRVNHGTVDADNEARRNEAIAELPPELRDKIGKLRDRQAVIRDSMVELHQRFGK